MEINPTVTMVDWTYGQKANTPSITVKLGKSDITASYDASGYTCTYYTDAGCTDMTTAADGAATNGGVPKNAGTYYVKVVVPENGNYAGGRSGSFLHDRTTSGRLNLVENRSDLYRK